MGQEVMPAEVLSMVDLVDYQEGSVVSRIVVKKTSSVTVFAFDQGQELSEHTAPFDALVHVVDGEAEISVDSVWHTLKEGEAILMPADRPHAVKAAKRFKMILTMIKS